MTLATTVPSESSVPSAEPEETHAGVGGVVLSRRLACENRKFDVYFDHVVDASGHEVKDYLVVAPKRKNANLVTGVAILPLVGDQVGLIRIWRPAIQEYSWEIPHGFVEADEADMDAAMRELAEETGLIAGSICSLGYITPDAGVLAARVQLFLAENCLPCGEKSGELGLGEFLLIDLREFEAMICNSEIQDTFTLATWCRYRIGHSRQERS